MMRRVLRWVLGLLIFLQAPAAAVAGAPPAPRHVVHDLKVTVLSTGIAGAFRAGEGEWGYSALIEADGHKILYDTGGDPELVLRNAAALHVKLSDVEMVVLSHNHPDHVGGLLALRTALSKDNPKAVSRAEVGEGIFSPRLVKGPADHNALNAVRAAYEKSGGVFEVHAQPVELAPGVWMTGPVPRVTREHNWQPAVTVPTATGTEPDQISEDSALVIETADGLVVITGCGHAGIVNIATYARRIGENAKVLAVIGGLHLDEAPLDLVDWTGRRLRAMGVRFLLAGHCTGLAATDRLRRDLHLPRSKAAMGAVGSTFSLRSGIGQPESAL